MHEGLISMYIENTEGTGLSAHLCTDENFLLLECQVKL